MFFLYLSVVFQVALILFGIDLVRWTKGKKNLLNPRSDILCMVASLGLAVVSFVCFFRVNWLEVI